MPMWSSIVVFIIGSVRSVCNAEMFKQVFWV